MHRLVIFTLCVIAMMSLSFHGWGERARLKMPLDLPAGGGLADEDEEDAPEAIQFFGSEYEGDGFFFLLDKSGSMNGGKIELLKEELYSAIDSLSHFAEFSMVAYSGNVISFSDEPKAATSMNKLLAKEWVLTLVAYGPTHMLDGATTLIPIANVCDRAERVIIAVGDGLPNQPGPEETLSGILTMNTESLPVNTILFGDQPLAVEFMESLAASTGGTFQNNP